MNSLTVFLLLVIAILLGIIAYLLRTGRSKIRISLSNDIHDEIGSLLTRAAMKVELLRTKTKDQFSELKIVERDLREAVQSFRNILWVLNHEERSMRDLISRIQSNLGFVFDATDFSFSVTDRTNSREFSSSFDLRRNILFIVKELAHNALKHSNGNFFEVVLNWKAGKWKLIVADNGTHSDSQIRMSGMGLKSIENRVQKLGGKVVFSKTPFGFFTEISF